MDINQESITLDRDAAYAMLIVVSELHARRCQEISDCGDMEKSTEISRELAPLVNVYNELELDAAKIDSREPNCLSVGFIDK